MFAAQRVRVKDLAERFPPGRARWYPKLRRYGKRLQVVLEAVGLVDLLIVWKAQGCSWHLTALISTLDVGIQEVMRAWGSRWSLEVSHRIRKQNLALGHCQCLRYAAQLQHAELVIDAFNLMGKERERTPESELTWKQAQQQAAANLRNALLTEKTRLVV